MQHAFDIVRQFLFLRELEQLAHDVEGRGASIDRHHGITQPGDRHLLARQATGQTFPVQIQCEVDASQVIVEIIGVADSKIYTEPLFEHRCVQWRDIGDEHLRGLTLYEPGGAAGK